jgi:osmotically-inducible protein OsmY
MNATPNSTTGDSAQVHNAPPRLRPPDLDLLAEVEEALWKDPVIRALDRNSLSVEVSDGAVFLSGHVASTVQCRRVEAVVWEVPAVLAVHNGLVADLELATAVAQALAEDPRTLRHVIRVGAYHGWIRMSGDVPESVAYAAEAVAARVPHVRGIIGLPQASANRQGGKKRYPFQPLLGSEVFASDGLTGTVNQVVINPRNRLVSHIAVLTRLMSGDPRPQRQVVVPVEALDLVTEGGVFLQESAKELAARPAFDEADFPQAAPDWVPPFPYQPGTVRWPRAAL